MKKSLLVTAIVLGLTVSLYGCDLKSKPDVTKEPLPTDTVTSEAPDTEPSEAPGTEPSEVPDDEIPEYLQYTGITGGNPADYGSFDDVITTTDYVYLQGDRIDVYLDKDVTYHGNLLSEVEKIMGTIEEVTGLSFYPEYSVYAASNRSTGNRQLYFGCDPFPDIPEYSDKLKLMVVVDRENVGLANCALGDCLVVISDCFDFYDEDCGPAVLIHELMHTIQERNSCHLLIDGDKLTEGYAAYHEHVICDKLTEFPFPAFRRSYYRDFIGTLNAETAEEVCTAPFYPIYGNTEEHYYVGYGMIQYMIEEAGGEETFNKFLDVVSSKVSEFWDSVTMEQQTEALKEVYGDDFYEKFGAWYAQTHTCTNTRDNIWGVRIAGDDEWAFDDFRSALFDSDPGTVITLDRTALISPHYLLMIPKDITLSVTDEGLIVFDGDFCGIELSGTLEVPNITAIDLDNEWSWPPYININGSGCLKINGIEISKHDKTSDNELTIYIKQEEKSQILMNQDVDVKGGPDALSVFERDFFYDTPSQYTVHVN